MQASPPQTSEDFPCLVRYILNAFTTFSFDANFLCMLRKSDKGEIRADRLRPPAHPHCTLHSRVPSAGSCCTLRNAVSFTTSAVRGLRACRRHVAMPLLLMRRLLLRWAPNPMGCRVRFISCRARAPSLVATPRALCGSRAVTTVGSRCPGSDYLAAPCCHRGLSRES